MSTSLLLRSTLPRHIARQPTLAGGVWFCKARASTTAASQEEGEFKYVPGGRESSLLPFPSESILLVNPLELSVNTLSHACLPLSDDDAFLASVRPRGMVQPFTKEP